MLGVDHDDLVTLSIYSSSVQCVFLGLKYLPGINVVFCVLHVLMCLSHTEHFCYLNTLL